jgi:hypothetical protein
MAKKQIAAFAALLLLFGGKVHSEAANPTPGTSTSNRPRASTGAGTRSWTDTAGRSIEAEVVRVNPNRTVVLKTSRGKVATLPFDTFSDADIQYLENLPANHGRPNGVSWQKMNSLFGLDIWQDGCLWDDPTSEAAKRMELEEESKTDFLENHRAYPLGEKKVLGEPVYTLSLYGGKEQVESLSLVFLNLGDLPLPEGTVASPSVVREMAAKIEASGKHIREALVPALGKPKRDALGKGELREKVWRWDWNGHAIMLSLQEGKYTALRIMPTARADRAGRAGKIKESDLKKRLASCVERRGNGDVFIRNIPMVDQGPKGYCAPATWERYLRYMDIPADMYLLALAAHTGIGGGTYSDKMAEATKSLVSSNGRELKSIGPVLKLETIAKQIDQGLPVMWHLVSSPEFRKAIYENSARRKGETPKRKKFGKGSIGHVCLVVGYNKKSGEIAVSDSWGPRFAERWVKIADAQKATRGNMAVIKW